MTLPIKCTDGYTSFCAGCLNTTQPLLETVSVPQTCKNHSKPRDSDHRGEGHLTQTCGKERASWKRSLQDGCKEATDLTRTVCTYRAFQAKVQRQESRQPPWACVRRVGRLKPGGEELEVEWSGAGGWSQIPEDRGPRVLSSGFGFTWKAAH